MKNPLQVLLESRRRGINGWRLMAYGTAGVVLGVGLPEYGMLMRNASADAGVITMWTLAAALLAIYPFVSATSDARILERMKKGHILADLELTGLSPADITDSLMRYSVCSVMRVGIWFYVPMVAFLAVAPNANIDTPSKHYEAVALAACWMPMLLVGTCCISYLAQMNVLFKDSARVFSWHYVMLYLLACVTSVPLSLSIALFPQFTLLSVAVLLIFFGLVGRTVVLMRLRGDDVQQGATPFWKRFRPSAPNPALRPWSKNPIVVREAAMEAHRVPWGAVGAMLWRFGAAPVVVAGMVSITREGGDTLPWSLLAGAFWLALLQIGRVAQGCMQAVWKERRQGTLEAVTQTSMTAEEFVDGWIESVCRPLILETLILETLTVGLVLLGAAGSYDRIILRWGFAALMATLFHMAMAAYVAIGISARIKHVTQAAWYFIGFVWMYWLLLVGPSWVFCCVVDNRHAGPDPIPGVLMWCVLATNLWFFVCRFWALSGVKGQAGFLSAR